jgi:flavin reductase (DIM6/NTAB) family NADH-FMN oxidoreductase RutF
MMLLDPANAAQPDVYLALIGAVTPRPIGWITTVDELGRVNLAPYSFFNAVSGKPPMVAFSAGLKRDGSKKDSHRNAEATGEFVWNAAIANLSREVVLSSKELPHGASEIDLTGLQVLPSVQVKPPRVAASPIHFECKVWKVVPLGDRPTSHLVIGQVVLMHIDERILDERGRIDPHRYVTLARLGGEWYACTTDLLEIKRPD